MGLEVAFPAVDVAQSFDLVNVHADRSNEGEEAGKGGQRRRDVASVRLTEKLNPVLRLTAILAVYPERALRGRSAELPPLVRTRRARTRIAKTRLRAHSGRQTAALRSLQSSIPTIQVEQLAARAGGGGRGCGEGGRSPRWAN